MAEKKKILYIVEAMGGGVFTYIVDLANELVNKYDMYIAYAVRKQTPKNYKDYTTSVRTLPEDKWIIAENAHAAIVTRDEYYQAQKAIRNVTPIQYKVGDDFALKGKICCGNCNRQLRHERQSGEMVFYCGYKKKNTRLGERIQEIFSTRRVFHSAGMCLLEAEGFYPCGQVGFAGIGIEHLAMQQFCTGAARSKLFIGLAHVAAARCGKGDDCFTLPIIAFQKCIDDRRSNIPPDRESDKDGVILINVITFGGDGRAGIGTAHFNSATGFLIHPVQIGFCVRDFGTDFKNVCTDGIC